MLCRCASLLLLVIFPAILYTNAQTNVRDSLKRHVIEIQPESINPFLVRLSHADSIIPVDMKEPWWKESENEPARGKSVDAPKEPRHETAFKVLDVPRFVAPRNIPYSVARNKDEIWQFALFILWAVAAWMAGLILLYLAGKLLSGLTLLSIRLSDVNTPASISERVLRKIYRIIINIGGIYYYISLFIIMVSSVACAVLAYMLFDAGRIRLALMGFIAVQAAMAVYKIVLSFFLKRRFLLSDLEPGRPLAYEEAPGLWELTKKVASDINMRPVDEIRITYGTEIAVYERGTRKEKMKDRARRILILGIANLNNFKQIDFCAVLAHEYGHFSHRDTAGGELAMRAGGDINNFFLAILISGQANWWNIAFQFIRRYISIFNSICLGASRLQEILADRVSAKIYGPLAFKNGFTHLIRSHLEFEYFSGREIDNSLKSTRPGQNLSEFERDKQALIESKLQTELGRKTGKDDTHPGPAERFRLVSQVNFTGEAVDKGLVWELFRDKDALTSEMTSLVEGFVRKILEEAESNKETEISGDENDEV